MRGRHGGGEGDLVDRARRQAAVTDRGCGGFVGPLLRLGIERVAGGPPGGVRADGKGGTEEEQGVASGQSALMAEEDFSFIGAQAAQHPGGGHPPALPARQRVGVRPRRCR
ncbi:hypothetical protein ABZ934_24555 [Streptomyces sp. NPDC046557]|uniref:hypothetical protein n=1 Tax=Streptomyces sp. NPDC046557 TaxID=3155372 RepID=UPI0033DF9FBE